jgi:tetrahydromethanopterin:alpha-L-glutamate ligase
VGRIAIFTDDPGWHGKQLCLAFAAYGYDCTYVSLTECRLLLGQAALPIHIPGFNQQLPDAVFVRGVPGGSLEEVVLYLDILHTLKLLGVPVYNHGQAIERSVDKAMASFLVQQAGLATPPTWVLRDRDHALAISEAELQQGHYLITKPLFGSQGEGIRRLEKMTDLFWLTPSQGVYYLQRFIRSPGNNFADYRVFVIHQQAVAAMRRCGQSWLNNVAQGANCQAISLSTEMANLAVQATLAVEMDYAGIDIIEDQDGQLWVLEVNSIPAWKGLQSVSTCHIANLLAADLIRRYLHQSASSGVAA